MCDAIRCANVCGYCSYTEFFQRQATKHCPWKISTNTSRMCVVQSRQWRNADVRRTRESIPGLVAIDIQMAKATMVTTFRWWRTSIKRRQRQAMYVQRNAAARSRNRRCRGKAISITYFKCLYYCLRYPAWKSLIFCAFLCCHVACLAQTHFSTLSHKRHDFRGGLFINKTRVLIVSTALVCNISHSKKHSANHYRKYKHVFLKSTRHSW
jgi:hypothetical protein